MVSLFNSSTDVVPKPVVFETDGQRNLHLPPIAAIDTAIVSNLVSKPIVS